MKKILVLSMALIMVAGFTFARGGPGENPDKGPSEQGNQNQRATENVPDHAEADLPFEIELESVVYEGICNEFGSHEGDTITLSFSNNIGEDGTVEIIFEKTQKLSQEWGKTDWDISDNILTVTADAKYSNPRNVSEEKVISVMGLVGNSGESVVVPKDGVEIEQSTSVTVSTEDELRDALACENIETIILADGTDIDLEDELVINRSVHLKAESEHSATISLHEKEGDESSSKTIRLQADDVIIEDLILSRTRAGEDKSVCQVIRVVGSNVEIRNNIINGNANVGYGISVQAEGVDKTDNVTITNNKIEGGFTASIGVIAMIGTPDTETTNEIGTVTITDNKLLDYAREGLQVSAFADDDGSIDDITVTDNYFDSEEAGWHIVENLFGGAAVLDWENIIDDNDFEDDVKVFDWPDEDSPEWRYVL